MPAIINLAASLAERQRNDRIYAGDIVIFRGFSEVGVFIDALRERCRFYLGDDPEHLHDDEAAPTINQTVTAMQKAIRADSRLATLFNAALMAVGVDIDKTYGDGIVVRAQTPVDADNRGKTAPLLPHRDTWGSNLPAQTNWWAPLFETTAECTLALFPGYFNRAVANDSANWNFEELRSRIRSDGVAQTTYPLLPTATETIRESDALPVSILPGDLMCFSGAHLHASVANTTHLTRLSFESRTVNIADIAAQRGAPAVDGHARCVTYQLFSHLITGERLSAEPTIQTLLYQQ